MRKKRSPKKKPVTQAEFDALLRAAFARIDAEADAWFIAACAAMDKLLAEADAEREPPPTLTPSARRLVNRIHAQAEAQADDEERRSRRSRRDARE